MKDDLREAPPPRVWGAEEYNKSEAKMVADRTLRRLGVWLRYLVYLIQRVTLYPLGVIGRFFASVWWSIPKEPRVIVSCFVAGFAALWGVAYLWHILPSEPGKLEWWNIPFFVTSVVVIGVAIIVARVTASFTKEEWKKIRDD